MIDFRDAAKILVASHFTAPDSKLKVVYKKYSSMFSCMFLFGLNLTKCPIIWAL